MKNALVSGLACLALAATDAAADSAIRSEAITFAKGASSATVKGTIKGDRIVDYRLRARSGQSMSVAMKTGHGALYFNVLPPGSKDVAIHVGSTGGNEWKGALEADGEYTVRVYLMRSAARRDESASYTLTVGIAGSAKAAPSPGPAAAKDAKVRGTPYHATGQVPCSMGNAAPGSAQCEFGVIRGGPGNAEVHVTPPGGLERVLTFKGDRVSADGGGRVKAARSGDSWVVEVNDYEHYRIPEAVISGG